MNDDLAREQTYRMMTETSVEKLVCRMAIPTITSMLVTSFYNIADTFFVGKIGTSATGAVGVVFPLMAVIQAFGFFFGQGSGNYISRKLGEKEPEAAAKMAATGLFSSFIAVALLSALGLFFIEPLCLLLGSTPTILPYAKKYMVFILLGAPFTAASFVLNNQLRLQGKAFYSMVGLSLGACVNIVLDPILIFGLKLGISGAALATMLSQILSFLLLLWGCGRGGALQIRWRNFSLSPHLYAEMAKAGIAPLLRQGLASVATIALNIAVRPYGDAAVAAMSIVNRVIMFASSMLIGFGQGFQPVCGFNYGAKRYRRVIRAFWFCIRTAFVVMTLLSAISFLAAHQIVAIFRKDDLEVIAIGAQALRYQSLSLPLWSWIIINNMMMQNIGEFKKSSMLSLARQGLFFLPLVFLLPRRLGILGVQISQPIADVLTFLLALYLSLAVLRRLKQMAKDEEEQKLAAYKDTEAAETPSA